MITAKGRNGYFQVAGAGVTHFPPTMDGKKEIYVDIFSSRSGKSSPITLTGPQEEIKELFQVLLNKINRKEV